MLFGVMPLGFLQAWFEKRLTGSCGASLLSRLLKIRSGQPLAEAAVNTKSSNDLACSPCNAGPERLALTRRPRLFMRYQIYESPYVSCPDPCLLWVNPLARCVACERCRTCASGNLAAFYRWQRYHDRFRCHGRLGQPAHARRVPVGKTKCTRVVVAYRERGDV